MAFNKANTIMRIISAITLACFIATGVWNPSYAFGSPDKLVPALRSGDINSSQNKQDLGKVAKRAPILPFIEEVELQDDMAEAALSEFFTFKDYVEECLYNPVWGYYSSGKVQISAKGDFETWPEKFSPLYGRMMAEYAFNAYRQMLGSGAISKKEVFSIIEFGAGNGTLAYDMLTHIKSKAAQEKQWDDFYSKVRYITAEKSPALRKRQSEKNKGFGEKFQTRQADAKNPGAAFKKGSLKGVVLSNELIDAFSPYKVVVSKDGLATTALSIPYIDIGLDAGLLNKLERTAVLNKKVVALKGKFLEAQFGLPNKRANRIYLSKEEFLSIKEAISASRDQALIKAFDHVIKFVEAYAPIDDFPEIARYLKLHKEEIDQAFSQPGPEELLVYVRPDEEGFVGGVSEILESGFVVTIDYGEPASEQFHSNRAAPLTKLKIMGKEILLAYDPYKEPGEYDITTNINFTNLQRLGARFGLEPVSLGTQVDFAMRNNLIEAISGLKAKEALKQRLVREGVDPVDAERLITVTERKFGQDNVFKVLVQTKNISPNKVGLADANLIGKISTFIRTGVIITAALVMIALFNFIMAPRISNNTANKAAQQSSITIKQQQSINTERIFELLKSQTTDHQVTVKNRFIQLIYVVGSQRGFKLKDLSEYQKNEADLKALLKMLNNKISEEELFAAINEISAKTAKDKYKKDKQKPLDLKLFKQMCLVYDVEPDVIIGILLVETEGFDANIVNDLGYQGLSQMDPSMGKKMWKWLNGKYSLELDGPAWMIWRETSCSWNLA